MRIVLINHSDSKGGASVVTYRLMKALRELGHDAQMLVTHKAMSDTNTVLVSAPFRIPFFKECLRVFHANGLNRDDLFKVSPGLDGLPLHRHPLVKTADAVIVNWINQGMMSLRSVAAIAAEKPVLWTMHDMWNMTGICHHAGSCNAFLTGCCRCPLLHGKASEHDLSYRISKLKADIYASEHIKFVAVSNWLADKARHSSLMRWCDVATINNAFPVEEFYINPKRSRNELGLPEGKKIILMGAARLDDPIKGLPYAIEALNRLQRDDVHAVFFGDMRNKNALQELSIPHTWLGTISDALLVCELYAHASVVISTSLYETLPGTLVEGQAAGCIPVAFDSGGQTDIIDNESTGYLVEPYNTKAFATALSTALDAVPSAEVLRQAVAHKFSSESIAKQYINLIYSEQQRR